jgi:hypothetical protein
VGNPYLKSGEFIVLTTDRLSINAVPFDAILTTERLILVDSRYGQYEPQVVPLSSILTVKAGQSARDDPIITITFATKSGESMQKPLDLVFTQQYGEQRDRECNEWVRKCIEHIVLARKAQGSAKKSARKKETGMQPLVRRWVAPEMIRPHTSENAPQPEPEDFIIAPELLESEPEPVEWDEFSGTTSEESGDDMIVPEPEEYPQAGESRDDLTYKFSSPKESPLDDAPEPEPFTDPVPAPDEGTSGPVIPHVESKRNDGGSVPVLSADTTQSPEPEPERVTGPEIPAFAAIDLPEVPGTPPSPHGPADILHLAEPNTVNTLDDGEFSSVLKKLAAASGWTPATETDDELKPAIESTPSSGTVSVEISRTDVEVPATGLSFDEMPQTAGSVSMAGSLPDQMIPADDNDQVNRVVSSTEEHSTVEDLHMPDTFPLSVETHASMGQETVSPGIPPAANPDMEPVRSGTIPGPAVPSGFPTGMALILVALLVIAGIAILLSLPLFSGGVSFNESPVIVTPSPAPITMAPIPITIPSTGTWIRVTYNGTFVGSIGNTYSLQQISGTGDQIYSPQTSSDIIQVSVQKQDYYGDTLNVSITTNGTIIAQRSTRAPHGTIDLLIDTRTGNPPGMPVHK